VKGAAGQVLLPTVLEAALKAGENGKRGGKINVATVGVWGRSDLGGHSTLYNKGTAQGGVSMKSCEGRTIFYPREGGLQRQGRKRKTTSSKTKGRI